MYLPTCTVPHASAIRYLFTILDIHALSGAHRTTVLRIPDGHRKDLSCMSDESDPPNDRLVCMIGTSLDRWANPSSDLHWKAAPISGREGSSSIASLHAMRSPLRRPALNQRVSDRPCSPGGDWAREMNVLRLPACSLQAAPEVGLVRSVSHRPATSVVDSSILPVWRHEGDSERDWMDGWEVPLGIAREKR
jgi:hypothetical protein